SPAGRQRPWRLMAPPLAPPAAPRPRPPTTGDRSSSSFRRSNVLSAFFKVSLWRTIAWRGGGSYHSPRFFGRSIFASFNSRNGTRHMALKELRGATQSWIFKVFVVLLICSFGAWGVNDIFRAGGGKGVAKVGGEWITTPEFQDRLRTAT